jgi:hypothetical protein
MLDALCHYLKYALRPMRKHPVLTVVAILCGRNSYCSLKLTSILTATGTGSLFL